MIIERFAALRTGITEGYLFVDAEEIAPASQFVEGTLLVAVTDIGLIGEACADEVVVVVELRVEADAERIVVQMLLVPADVAGTDCPSWVSCSGTSASRHPRYSSVPSVP